MERLPRLYLIADVDTALREEIDLVAAVEQFVTAGGRMVSLRPGGLGGGFGDRKLMELGRHLSGLLFSVGGLFLVHRRPDLAILVGSGGIHLPSHGFERRHVAKLMGHNVLVGRSCHDANEVEEAEKNREAFVTLGPLFESVSKEGYGPGLEFEQFEAIANDTEIPIFALGGVLPDNGGRCLEAGAYGLAVVGGILCADDVAAATGEYLAILEDD